MGSLEHTAATTAVIKMDMESDTALESLVALFALPEPEVKLSRKERKRLAAQKHAEDYGTLTDTIVRHGAAAVVESALVAPPILSRPFAGLPLDVVEHVLLPFLTLESIRALMLMAPGVKHLMESRDDVWLMLYNAWDLPRAFREKIMRARGRSSYQSGTWRFRVETLLGARPHSEDIAAAKRAAERERLVNSKGSERVRALLREKTACWTTEEIFAWVLDEDEGNPNPRYFLELPTEWVSGYSWWSHAPVRRKMVRASTRHSLPKAVVHKQQFECPHRNVMFVRTQHWFKCADCNLVTHATTVPADVYQE